MTTQSSSRPPISLRQLVLRRIWAFLRDYAAVAIFCNLVVYTMLISLKWRPAHDAPLMLYVGYAMDVLGKVPYRDIFEMNPPGTHLLHQGIVALAGTSDFTVRLIDVLALLGTQACVIWFMRPFGWAAGLVAACTFGYQYDNWGTICAFQREALALLPIAFSLAFGIRSRSNLYFRFFVVGVLHAIAASIKPPLAISLPIIYAAMIWQVAAPKQTQEGTVQSRRRAWGFYLLRTGLAVTAGAALVVAGITFYLYTNDALYPFLQMAKRYWPLYAQLNGAAQVRAHAHDMIRVRELANSLRNYVFLLPFAAACLGPMARGLAQRQRDIVLIAALCFSHLVYIYVSGKFWFYHLDPLALSAGMACGLLVSKDEMRSLSRAQRGIRTALALAFIVGIWHAPDQAARIKSGAPYLIRADIEQTAAELRTRLQPGDTVQPLDVTKGAVHAMLLAQAPLATRFMYDFHFYHHPRKKIIHQIRERFLLEMDTVKPRFVLEAIASTWRPLGENTGDFIELKIMLARDYQPVWNNMTFRLYERKQAPPQRRRRSVDSKLSPRVLTDAVQNVLLPTAAHPQIKTQ